LDNNQILNQGEYSVRRLLDWGSLKKEGKDAGLSKSRHRSGPKLKEEGSNSVPSGGRVMVGLAG